MTEIMVKKTIYSAPEAELIEVGFEKRFLGSFDKDNNTEIITDDGDEDLL